MFTIHRPELAPAAAALRDQHAELLAGRWSATRLAEHQTALFRDTLRYVQEKSPYYRKHLGGLDPDNIDPHRPESLAVVPFTTKEDLRAAQRDILAKPLSEAWIFYETTGTTGASTPCPRDNVDSLSNNSVLTAYYSTIFAAHGDDQIIGVSGPTELHAFGDTFGEVCRNLGLAVAKMWPHSPMVGFDRALEVMRSFPLTGLFCTPGMALSLAKKAEAAGLDPRRDFALDVLMLTGELASPNLLANIGQRWDARAYNALYASQEASVLGAAGRDGRLYTAPLINFYEVVDPATGDPAPARADGVRCGELVVTHLYQGSKPLVRYRTGDLVRWAPGDPAATLAVPALEVLGRSRDEITLNGHSLSGYDLENLLLAHIRGYQDYQIAIDRQDGADTLTLCLQGDVDRGDPAVARTVEECRAQLDTVLTVTSATLGSVTGTGAMVSWKAARVVDRRPDGTDAEAQAAAALGRRRS